MFLDPYLWLHMTGLALLPLTLVMLAIALAWGIPFPLPSAELLAIFMVGGMPVWVLQILRPWNPFSFLFFQIPPERMDERQKKILRLIQGTRKPLLNAGGAVVMAVLLWQIAHYAPLAKGVSVEWWQWRTLGLGMALAAFFFSNLLLQIPLTLLPALLNSEKTLESMDPHANVSIRRDFACWGIPMGQLFPSTWR